jgi:DNA-binding NarL/FixJ family response regulator
MLAMELERLLAHCDCSDSLMVQIAESLSTRECEVLCAFLRCRQIKSVAQSLGTKGQTVRNQLANIRCKLGVQSQIDLISRVLLALFRERERKN